MSFWKGSAWQDRIERERERQEKARLRAQIIKQNPSLQMGDVEKVAAAEWARLHPPAPSRCCPCQSPSRAEWVSVHGGPCVCSCSCHHPRTP
jgi:hypothetical protein